MWIKITGAIVVRRTIATSGGSCRRGCPHCGPQSVGIFFCLFFFFSFFHFSPFFDFNYFFPFFTLFTLKKMGKPTRTPNLVFASSARTFASSSAPSDAGSGCPPRSATTSSILVERVLKRVWILLALLIFFLILFEKSIETFFCRKSNKIQLLKCVFKTHSRRICWRTSASAGASCEMSTNAESVSANRRPRTRVSSRPIPLEGRIFNICAIVFILGLNRSKVSFFDIINVNGPLFWHFIHQEWTHYSRIQKT